MNTQLRLNPVSGEWEEIELDECGFPKTEERLAEFRAVESNADLFNEAIDRCKELQEANPRPSHFKAAVFNCHTGDWTEVKRPTMQDLYPSEEQQWPSWTEGQDGKWYAPTAPSRDDKMYFWNEVEQAWFSPAIP